MTTDNFIKISHVVVILLLLISVGLNVFLLTKKSNKENIKEIKIESVDTLYDTVTERIPQVKYEKYVKTVKDTLIQSITNHDTVKVEAYIPITQKEYSKDSSYRAWVSGYRQNLDSIQIYNSTRVINKTVTRKPVISIGPTIVGGYDPINKNFSGMIGVGITYDLFNIYKKNK